MSLVADIHCFVRLFADTEFVLRLISDVESVVRLDVLRVTTKRWMACSCDAV